MLRPNGSLVALAHAHVAAHPREDLFEEDAEDQRALVVVEVGDAHDHGGGLAVLGREPALDVERRAFAPRRERRRGEERVHGGCERATFALGQERVEREGADLLDGRLGEIVEQRRELRGLAGGEPTLGEDREQDVLAASRRIGIASDEPQHQRHRGGERGARGLGIVVPPRRATLEGREQMERLPRARYARVPGPADGTWSPREVAYGMRIRCFATLLIVPLAGCAARVSPGEGTPTPDAAAIDPIADANPSPTHETGSHETGGLIDADVEPSDGSPLSRGHWGGISIFPDCPPSIAVDPFVAVPPLRWIDCASGRAGCRIAAIDWATGTPWDRLEVGMVSANVVDGKQYFTHNRQTNDWVTNVVQEGFDGPAIFAAAFSTKAPLYCDLHATIGAAGIAISGAVGGSGRPSWVDGTGIVGSMKLGGSPVLRFADSTDYGAIPFGGVSLVAGDRRAFATSGVPAALFPFDLASLSFTSSSNGSHRPVIVPDGALGEALEPSSLVLVRDDGSSVVWRTPAPVAGHLRRVMGHDIDATKRDTVSWLECDSDGSDPVLWSAPYTPEPAKVAARRVGQLPAKGPLYGTDLVHDDGEVLVVLGPDRAAIIRLADGVGWEVKGEPGMELRWPEWVDSNEAVVAVDIGGAGVPNNILRIRRDTLGAPTLKLAP